MEQIDRELERLETRRGPEVFQPPPIRTLVDIKRVLADLDPARYVTVADTNLQAELASADERGQMRTYKVSAKAAPQTKRSILIAGFEVIKKRLELQRRVEAETTPTLINGVAMKPAIRLQTNGFLWVEPLLRRWLNAYRDGLWICWDLEEATYRYDIFAHKIYRVQRQTANRGDR